MERPRLRESHLRHDDSNCLRLGANRAGVHGRGKGRSLTIFSMVLVETAGSKLGAFIPHPAAPEGAAQLGKGALRPPLHPSDQRRAALDWQLRSLAPQHPRVRAFAPRHPRQGTRPGSLTLPNRAPVGYAVRGFRAPDTHDQGDFPLGTRAGVSSPARRPGRSLHPGS